MLRKTLEGIAIRAACLMRYCTLVSTCARVEGEGEGVIGSGRTSQCSQTFGTIT